LVHQGGHITLYCTLKFPESTVSVSKVTQRIFFEETNFDCYVKLILTASFRELTEEEEMYVNLYSLQKLKENI
jgi:hypothetical protein